MYTEKESPLKHFALGLILLVASSTTLAAENFTAQCPNLAGRFFFANNPSQSVTIEQNGCVLSMTSENSGHVGKPVRHLGDGVWRLTHDTSYETETQASFARSDAFVIETKVEKKRPGQGFHLIESYQLRASGDITLKSSIRSGEIVDSATRLLVRE